MGMDRVEHLRRRERIARHMRGWDWYEIDTMLDGLRLPTSDRWEGPDNQSSYTIAMLTAADEEDFDVVERYLGLAPMSGSGGVEALELDPDGLPWEDGYVSAFLGHPSAFKREARVLAVRLEEYGVKGFVAHEDLDAGLAWSAGIKNALATADVFVGMVYEGFNESEFCQQEVGFALARGIPMIPIRYDVNPKGFFGEIQALQISRAMEGAVPTRLVSRLLDLDVVREHLIDCMLQRLKLSGSFNQSRSIKSHLDAVDPDWTPERLEALEEAVQNGQVADAWGVEAWIKGTIAANPMVSSPAYTPPPPSDDDVPF